MKSTGRLWLLAVCLLCGLVCNGKGQCGEDAESCCQEGKENQENPDGGTICKVAGNVPTTRTTPTTGSSPQAKFVETLSK